MARPVLSRFYISPSGHLILGQRHSRRRRDAIRRIPARRIEEPPSSAIAMKAPMPSRKPARYSGAREAVGEMAVS